MTNGSNTSGAAARGPGTFELAKWPAAITLGVTLLRLVLELAHAPDWLASRKAGGGGALLGISWLPIVFGPWFAIRIGRALPDWKSRLKRLFATLVVYGYLARIPVFLLFFADVAFGWGTHYAAFPEKAASWSMAQKTGALALFQLGFWPIVWTGVVGLIAGVIALATVKPTATSSVATTPTR